MGYNEKGEWVNPRDLRPTSKLEQNIHDNLYKVKSIAITFRGMTGLPEDELRSVASSYLLRAARTYREDKPANFSTWLNNNLYLDMLNYLRDGSRLIRMPRKYVNMYLKAKKLKRNNPDVSLKDLAKEMDVDLSILVEIFGFFNTKIKDINYYKEEIVGEDSAYGSEFEYCSKYSFNKKDKGVNVITPEYLDELTEEELDILEDTLVKNLCDNTLIKKYKQKVEEILDNAAQLGEEIYLNA